MERNLFTAAAFSISNHSPNLSFSKVSYGRHTAGAANHSPIFSMVFYGPSLLVLFFHGRLHRSRLSLRMVVAGFFFGCSFFFFGLGILCFHFATLRILIFVLTTDTRVEISNATQTRRKKLRRTRKTHTCICITHCYFALRICFIIAPHLFVVCGLLLWGHRLVPNFENLPFFEVDLRTNSKYRQKSSKSQNYKAAMLEVPTKHRDGLQPPTLLLPQCIGRPFLHPELLILIRLLHHVWPQGQIILRLLGSGAKS